MTDAQLFNRLNTELLQKLCNELVWLEFAESDTAVGKELWAKYETVKSILLSRR